MRSSVAYLIIVTFLGLSCSKNKLPILGIRQVENGDTLYAKTPYFSFLNQYGNRVDQSTLHGQIHVANFFFTSCPTICPKTIRSMIRISEHFKGHPKISYLNFSIDYKKDTVGRLKSYYDKLQVPINQFYLLHIPSLEEIKRVTEGYMSIAVEDPDAPGGFDHSGWLLLADKNFHIRSYCLGTDDQEVDRFIEDIESLLNEMD